MAKTKENEKASDKVESDSLANNRVQWNWLRIVIAMFGLVGALVGNQFLYELHESIVSTLYNLTSVDLGTIKAGFNLILLFLFTTGLFGLLWAPIRVVLRNFSNEQQTLLLILIFTVASMGTLWIYQVRNGVGTFTVNVSRFKNKFLWETSPGNGQIWVWGEEKRDDTLWGQSNKGFLFFNYATDLGAKPSAKTIARESAGGYIIFSEMPVDLSSYRYLVVNVRAGSAKNKSKKKAKYDLGIRLVLDDPNTHDEAVVRELPSLREIGFPVTDSWREFKIGLTNFPIVKQGYELPAGTSINYINKLVYFVDGEIVKNAPSGRLYVRDASFER